MELSEKRLIALDVDGTLLNSRKEILPETIRAVREAAGSGMIVAFATGRAVAELKEQFSALPEMRYAIFSSGAGIYDRREKKAFALQPLSAESVRSVLRVARGKDLMPQVVLEDRDVVQESHLADLERYHMGIYRPMYEKAMTLVPDIYAFAEAHEDRVLKLNLYHADPEERVRTRQQLGGMELVYSEVSSLECSAPGVNKGTGLERLCALLGIQPENCAAVGDAENDIPMLQAAGTGIAMGNAAPDVRRAADWIVPDLDHGGCAEAIRCWMEKGRG